MDIAHRKIHPHLPIFELTAEGRSVAYVPGHLVSVSQEDAARLLETYVKGAIPKDQALSKLAEDLESCAKDASNRWTKLVCAPFEPECLTLYLSNQCNLGCPYCYAAQPESGRRRKVPLPAGEEPSPILREDTVMAAARLVARFCAGKRKPLTVVFHGGGEPTAHWTLLQNMVALTRQIAAETGVGWWGYLATHGVFSEEKAVWIAQHFDLIGLSCDGPPEIQDRQRPGPGQRATSTAVERTAEIFRQQHAMFDVRVTIAPQSVGRQTEIVAYVQEKLQPREIHLEPAYRPDGLNNAAFAPEDAGWFATHFLAAEIVAQETGTSLSIADVRLDEIHGPYCNVLRDTLHLTPDGAATACFLCTDSRRADDAAMIIGRMESATGEFVVDRDRIAALRQRAAFIPDRCGGCVNIYHCVRECPEVCPVAGQEAKPQREGGFRCQVQKTLGKRWIFDAPATNARPDFFPSAAGEAPSRTEVHALAEFFAQAPRGVDVGEIARQWQRARRRFSVGRRHLPAPTWATRGFTDDGQAAWRQLSRACSVQIHSPMSVYVHIPFCDRKCAFCDCYAIRAGNIAGGIAAQYARALLMEIEAWDRIMPLSRRAVTTVHFGGGTADYLGAAWFAKIVEHLKSTFAPGAGVEWALETTSTQLTDEHRSELLACGFRRLHVGVQTLEEPLRQEIGRKESATQVLKKLTHARDDGFVVSVDLIYGLPGQTVSGFSSDLERLTDCGVHGFSVYQLNSTSRNRRFAAKHNTAGRDPFRDYLFFQLAEQLLRKRGYKKNHFAHFARTEDKNLYYTHARRGEDLLALGTTADGIFGDYRYRHPELRQYLRINAPARPALEGGVWEDSRERGLRPVTAGLMAGGIERSQLLQVAPSGLPELWLEAGLMEEKSGQFNLLANGSWFIGEMLAQLAAREVSPGRHRVDLIEA